MKNVLRNCAAVAVCGMAVASVQANDNKTYPGSMAVKWQGSTPSYMLSSIGNPSSLIWMYVDLPAINDSNGSIANSQVKVVDRHYDADIRCSVKQLYWNSSTDSMAGYWGAKYSSNGASDNLKTITTGALPGYGLSFHSFISCRVPPSYSGNESRIVSYYVSEN